MKVVVISSSPRRHGNSEVLCDAFIKGASEAGHEVEKFVLADYRIEPCIACEYCRSHDHQCFKKDDADQVIDAIIHSDVVLFASPIYFYSITGQLKVLFDRFFAREYEIRESQKRKQAYLLLTSGATDDSNMAGAIESFRGFIKVLRTVDEAGIIEGYGAFQRGDAIHHPAYQKAYEIGLHI